MRRWRCPCRVRWDPLSHGSGRAPPCPPVLAAIFILPVRGGWVDLPLSGGCKPLEPRPLSRGRPWARTRRCSPPGPVPARRHSSLCSAVVLCQLRISGIAVIPIFWNCAIPFFRSCRNSIRFGAIIAARHAGAPPSAPLARPLTMPLRIPWCPSPPRSRTPPTARAARSGEACSPSPSRGRAGGVGMIPYSLAPRGNDHCITERDVSSYGSLRMVARRRCSARRSGHGPPPALSRPS